MLGEKKLSIVFQVSGGKLLEGGGIGIEGGIVLHINYVIMMRRSFL